MTKINIILMFLAWLRLERGIYSIFLTFYRSDGADITSGKCTFRYMLTALTYYIHFYTSKQEHEQTMD